MPSAGGPAAARVQQAGRAESSALSAFPGEQLGQLVAPIALYPDELLAHVLIAEALAKGYRAGGPIPHHG